ARDGGYVWANTATSLTAWATSTGAQLFSKSGNYDGAKIDGAPGQLDIASGSAPGNAIEHITTAGVSTQSTAFTGTFESWFLDGGSFITRANSDAHVYTKDALQVAFILNVPAEPLAGWGTHIWARAGLYQLSVYDVTQPAAAATSF